MTASPVHRRTGLVLAASLATLAIPAAAAHGAIVTVNPFDGNQAEAEVTVQAVDATEQNTLQVTVTTRTTTNLFARPTTVPLIIVEETRPDGPQLFTLVPVQGFALGCTRVAPRRVECTNTAAVLVPITGLRINLGARNDVLDIVSSGAVPAGFGAADRNIVVNAGTGNDTVNGADFTGDRIDGESGFDEVNGRGGNDELIGGLSDDLLIGGTGVDSFSGGAGTDTINAADGISERIFCGIPEGNFLASFRDTAIIDLQDSTPSGDCENIQNAPADNHPTIAFVDRAAILGPAGVSTRLRCPVSRRRPCAGVLTALRPLPGARGRAIARTTYSVRPGRTLRVSVPLTPAQRRTVAGLRSLRMNAVEPGSIGPRTTSYLLARR